MTIGELAVTAIFRLPQFDIGKGNLASCRNRARSDQGRYAPDAVQRLAVLRLAQACGFRLDRNASFASVASDSVRSRRAGGKNSRSENKQELDEQIARLKAMRRVVDRVMQCQCLELTECGRIAASVMETAAMNSACSGMRWPHLARLPVASLSGRGCGSAKARSGRCRALFRSFTSPWP